MTRKSDTSFFLPFFCVRPQGSDTFSDLIVKIILQKPYLNLILVFTNNAYTSFGRRHIE